MKKIKAQPVKKMRIKKGDKVAVIAGTDKGKQGKVLNVDKKTNRVIVEGINMISRHTKQGRQSQQGGIIRKEAPIHASNVMYVHEGKPTRLGVKVIMEEKKGITKAVRYRIAKTTGEIIK